MTHIFEPVNAICPAFDASQVGGNLHPSFQRTATPYEMGN